MSSLLEHLDSNQSENDDIHLLFPKCNPKPIKARASSVGSTQSQSSESQSNSQQYLADNFRDQNLNHPSTASSLGGGSNSARQSSRRHSSSGFTHHHQQRHQQHHQAQQPQQLPDNLLKHSKHSSYPPLLTATSPTTSHNNTGNNSYISHGSLSPYDNNNLNYDTVGISNNKSESRSSHHSSSRHHHHHLQQQQQSDSSDNFPVTPSFSSSSNFIANNSGGFGGSNLSGGTSKKGDSHSHHHHHHSSNIHHGSSGVKSGHHHHSHSRSKNSISSRNSRHEAAAAAAAAALGSASGTTGSVTSSCQSQTSRHHSRSSHHHYSTSERPHHRSKRVTHMTESSSCEPISPASGNKTLSSSSRYNKSQKSLAEGSGGGGGGPTKSYSTLSLGSGMECEPLDDHHYDDGFCTTRSSRNLATSSNGAPYSSEHASSVRASNNIPGNGGCLRDSRIEIAGGREVYSQNRIRAGRRLRGSSSTSSSTEMMADSSMSMTASSSSSIGTKSRKKSPNIQPQHPQQHQPQLVCTNGENDDGGSNGEHSVWEPKHSKGYQENTLLPTRPHHSNSHRHHGSQHHHHHHHHQQHHHHHQSHARNRHVCGYPHCDHTKVLSSADTSPACGGSYSKSNSGGPNMSHNNSSSGPGPMTVKETVFSTEITSIEKPIETESNTGSKVMRPTPTSPAAAMQPPYIYETGVNEPRGEIIFDDIGNWGRNGGAGRDAGNSNNGGGSGSAAEAGLCVERSNRKDMGMMKRSPSGGRRSSSSNAQGAQLNIFHSDFMDEHESGMHCCGVEDMNHSGSSMNTSSAPTVLLQGSPSPSTRGGNTTPSGYESDEYSGVTPVSLNLLGCNNKGCLPNNRLIGQVPIAEYEGSPKRYGLRQPTHPMPTHLDLVDVDIPMDNAGLRSPTDINCGVSGIGSVGSAHHVVSLMSPSQPNKPTVPTTASSSSSSSLDNTNSNTSSTSSNRNLYSSRISPRVLSPSQSVSNFPSRVPGFPQRITPVTSSLDSSSLVDSGLEKSEATDTIKSDSMLETEGDMLANNPCHHPDSTNNDECPQQQQDQMRLPYHQQQQQPPPHHHRHHQQQISHLALTPQQKTQENNNAHSHRSSEIDEPPSSTSLCQGQLVNSDHSSDLLLTDQLNIKAEKCTPSSTTNLCGNPLVDESHQMHHHLHQQHQLQHHNMVLELVDSTSLSEDHHQSVQQHHQQSTIHSASTGDESTKQHNASHSSNNSDSIVEDQCLISVPSSSSDVLRTNDNSGNNTSVDGNNLLGMGANSADYLYEFSETRKVLEEFFGNASVGGASGGMSTGAPSTIIGLDGSSMNQGPLFDDLDYTLKRQAGNSYVGLRLAGESCNAVEESPKKPTRRGVLLIGSSDGDGGDGGEAASPRLISFQEITLPQIQQQQQQQKSAQNPPRDLNDNDIDGDTSSTNTETDNLGDTEVGLQVGLSRNFTLSPETTDCDSNELESEISLDYEASLHSSSRVGVSMPNVEDGLSSGNVSDTEETVPSSDHLSNDLKRVAQQQGLLCSTTSGSSNNPCSSNTSINNNSSSGRPQISSSSTGIGLSQQHSLSRREHSQQQNPIAHHQQHHHHHHHHLIEDGLGCNGTQQGAAVGVSLPSSSSSATNSSTSAAQQLSLQTSFSSSSASQQQQHPVSPSSSSSISTTKIPSDPNPTLLLMKKQISEIEKEIKMRASQQNQKMQLQHNSLDTPTNSHNNSIMPVTTDEQTSSGTSSNNNIASLNNGNSCVTTNGNGLASQLNVSSCPDVSSLSNNSATPSNGANGGQGAGYTQQQLSSSSTGNNVNGPSHRGNADSSLVSGNGLQQHNSSSSEKGQETTNFDSIDIELEALDPMRPTPPPSPAPSSLCQPQTTGAASGCTSNTNRSSSFSNTGNATSGGSKIVSAAPINIPTVSGPPGSSSNNSRIPNSATESNTSVISPDSSSSSSSVAAAIQDIKEAIQRTKTLPRQQPSHVETSRPSPLTSSQSHVDAHNSDTSPVWVPRQGTSSYHHHRSGGGVKDPLLRKQRYDETPDDDADTDQETDRLLGQTRTEDDYGFYDEKEWKKVKNCRSLLPALNKGVSFVKSAASGSVQPLGLSSSASSLNAGAGSNSSNAHGVPYSSSSNTIAPNSARISPAHFKQQQEPLPSSQLNSSSSNNANNISSKPKKEKDGIKKKRSKEDFKNPSVLIEGVLFRARYLGSTQLVCEGQPTKATRMMQAEEAVSRIKTQVDQSDLSSETEPLGTLNVSDSAEPTKHSNNTTSSTSIPTSTSTTTTTTSSSSNNNDKGEQAQSHFEDYLYAEDDDSGDESCAESEFFHKGHHAIQSPTSSARSFQGPCFGGTSPGDPGTLPPSSHFGPACGSALPGTMFRLKFIGSLEVDEEVGSGKRRRKRPKKTMVEEAVLKMKAPEGETQPSTEVDLFISTEKIMVLNTDLKEIMMDHALRTISYIADIGDLVVLMARRRPVPTDTPDDSKIARPPKMICHVFESDEAQYIAQSIGQAFQVAYMEFLKANGIEDQSFVREMDYQEVLNSQEIFGDELQMFAKKELQKEVVVPKSKGEILGVVIVESGWGSMLPTVVIANLAPAGAAARCGQLNIGDQIIAINGVSLVGLPLSTCQNYIKNTKSQTVVKLTVVPCPPVVEVKIKRPDTKYQLGFSVQNGVICSLLRGGIAERGGVRVGHRIIEINGQSVVAVPHEKIVNLLATSVGEINMKTMPTSMFRLLTGQETPLYI